jgi:ketosteroid isomerase-like protein
VTPANAAALAREYLAVWNETGDPSAISRRFWHDDIEWIEPPDSPIGHTFRGRNAVEGLLREWIETMGPNHAVIEEIVVEGDEVMTRVRLELHGTNSGLDLDAPLHFVSRLRGHRFDRIRVFLDRDAALEAMGDEEAADDATPVAETADRLQQA